jgi:hypothetical protein
MLVAGVLLVFITRAPLVVGAFPKKVIEVRVPKDCKAVASILVTEAGIVIEEISTP